MRLSWTTVQSSLTSKNDLLLPEQNGDNRSRQCASLSVGSVKFKPPLQLGVIGFDGKTTTFQVRAKQQ